jgi:hypothetical protein
MRSKLLLASLLVGFFPMAALAVPISGAFTGTVWGVTDGGASVPGAIGAGAQVTGAFQFENIGQAPFSQVDGVNQSSYLSYSPGSFFRMSIGSLTWEANGLSVIVRNDSSLGDDLFQLVFNSGLPAIDPAFPGATSFPGAAPDATNSSFAISLFDTSSMNLVSSQALPDSASQVNLPAINFANGSIFGATGPNTFYAINFNVDSVSMRDVERAVPEPGTLPLMAGGFFAVWLLARRRGAAASNAVAGGPSPNY